MDEQRAGKKVLQHDNHCDLQRFDCWRAAHCKAYTTNIARKRSHLFRKVNIYRSLKLFCNEIFESHAKLFSDRSWQFKPFLVQNTSRWRRKMTLLASYLYQHFFWKDTEIYVTLWRHIRCNIWRHKVKRNHSLNVPSDGLMSIGSTWKKNFIAGPIGEFPDFSWGQFNSIEFSFAIDPQKTY